MLTYVVFPWKLTVDWPVWVDTEAGSVTREPVLDIAIGTLVEACPEFMATWQLSGKPDCRVCGHASAVGFRPKSDSVVCADEAPMFAIKTALSSWSIKALVTLNGTVALPATGWSRGGTLTWVLLDESRMPGLLADAAPERVIWQALVPPPMSVCTLQAMPLTDTFAFPGPSRVKVWDAPWLGALITTDVVDETAEAVAVKVALVKPVPIVIEFGMVTVALEDVNAITVLVCAALPRLNVHALVPGVWMDAGEHTRLGPLDAGVMVRVAERTIAPRVAVMVALPDAFAAAAALKAADDAPAEIATEPGTVTWGLLLLSDTLAPFCPAGPLKETVQALELPAATVSGVQSTEAREDCAVTASEKVTEEPPKLAVRTAEPAVPPVAVKFALVVPDAIVTDGGTDAEELLLDNATVTPPDGAVAVRNTVQVAVAPGAMVPGVQDMLDNAACGCSVSVID